MSRAIIWTTSSLTGGTIITIVTVTLAGGSITDTLVRALHVVMGGSIRGSSLGVLHVWEDLVGSSRVDGGTFDDSSSKATDDVIVIQVTLWGIDVSKVEWTGACWLAKIQGSRGRGRKGVC